MSDDKDSALNEKKFICISMLNVLYIVSLAYIIPAIKEIEHDMFMLFIFILLIIGGVLVSIHLVMDLNWIAQSEGFYNEKVIGLRSQIFIIKKYREEIRNEIEKFKFIKTKKEIKTLENNLISLKNFEMIRDYKYSMIAMGSILEFLLIKYCTIHNIHPVDYVSPDGSIINANKKRLVNYIQSAINNNLFNQSKKWKFIQTHLRDFRNYVHISKECIEEEIDKNWYKSIKPIFYSIFKSFKS